MVAVVVLVALALVNVSQESRLAGERDKGIRAEAALCVLRADYERRLHDTKQFLKDLDSGRRDPIPGITRADFGRTVAGLTANIHALRNLNC